MSFQKVAIITGANGVIGREISRQLILSQYNQIKQSNSRNHSSLKLILVCRSEDKVRNVQDYLAETLKKSDSPKIKPSFSSSNVLDLQFEGSPSHQATVHGELADLSSYASVQKLIQQIKSQHSKIDILVNNAAVAPPKKEITEDNLEVQWAVNVMSYYWITSGLEDVLHSEDAQNPSNVVFVASNYARGLNLGDVNFTQRQYNPNEAYTATKQANRLLARGFSEHFAQKGLNIRINACHPGVTTSNILTGLGMASGFDSAEQSAKQPVCLATSRELGSGEYYSGMKKVDCPFGKNGSMVSGLWSLCQELTTQIKTQKL